jgi:hypothetical protein
VGLTHGAEVGSDCRQCPPTADLSFYISRTPPFRLSFHLCVSRCTGAFPVGSSVERDSSGWSRVRSAAVVLRGFVDLPLFAQGQHYVFYLSCTTGGGGSVSLITTLNELSLKAHSHRHTRPAPSTSHHFACLVRTDRATVGVGRGQCIPRTHARTHRSA